MQLFSWWCEDLYSVTINRVEAIMEQKSHINEILSELSYWVDEAREFENKRCKYLVSKGVYRCKYGSDSKPFCGLVRVVAGVKEYPEEFYCDRVRGEIAKREDALVFDPDFSKDEL